jgi:HEAT repeat protein
MSASYANLDAQAICRIMLEARETERDAVQEAVISGELKPDRALLRTLVLQELTSRFYPGSEVEGVGAVNEIYVDNAVARTRTWLVSILSIVADDDVPTRDHLKQYFDPQFETNPWIPYWIIFGMIRSGAPHTREVALTAADHPEPLVSMAATAILAQPVDGSGAAGRAEAEKWRQKILLGLESDDEKELWAALRALRLVHLQNTSAKIRQQVCAIVEKGLVQFTTYDAIVALSYVKPNSAASIDPAEEAAESLVRFIERNRRNPLQDGTRVKALRVLGELKVEKSEHTLLEELIDENPAVARAAAGALENILGARRAVGKVLEDAVEHGSASPNTLRAYANALRWMQSQTDIAEELEAQMGSSVLANQETARQLLAEIGGPFAFQKLAAMKRSIEQFTAMLSRTEESVRKTFEDSIEKAKLGFRYATIMDWSVFIVGLALLGVSGALVLRSEGDLTNWVAPLATGGLGVMGILYTNLVLQPRRQIRDAVQELMRLQVLYMGYVRQLTEIDQAYTRMLLEDEKIDPDTVARYSGIIEAQMRKALNAVGRAESSAGENDQ